MAWKFVIYADDYCSPIIAVTIIYPIILNQMVEPGIDQGPLLTGYLGLTLLTSAMLAIGVFVSALYSNQIAAFVTTLGILILLWWIIAPISQVMGVSTASEIIRYLDLGEHFYANLYRGVIDLRDITFYLSLTALGLFLGTLSVEVRRWH
jgi:ABC-2 type transport system permease protein